MLKSKELTIFKEGYTVSNGYKYTKKDAELMNEAEKLHARENTEQSANYKHRMFCWIAGIQGC